MYQTTHHENIRPQKYLTRKRKSPSLVGRVLGMSLTFIVTIGAAPVIIGGKISELY